MKRQYVLTVYKNGTVRLGKLSRDQIIAKCHRLDPDVRRWGIIPTQRAGWIKCYTNWPYIWFTEKHGWNGIYWISDKPKDWTNEELTRLFGY